MAAALCGGSKLITLSQNSGVSISLVSVLETSRSALYAPIFVNMKHDGVESRAEWSRTISNHYRIDLYAKLGSNYIVAYNHFRPILRLSGDRCLWISN